MSSQSSSGAAPSSPHTHACAELVIGRRRPVGESSSPETALNSEDLPLPVPPASATMVCSPDSSSRSPARPSSSAASLSRRGSTRPAPSSTRRSRTARRSVSTGATGSGGASVGRGVVVVIGSAPGVGEAHLAGGRFLSSGDLQVVRGLVEPDRGGLVGYARLVQRLAEPDRLLVEQHADPAAQVGARLGAHAAQRLG